MDILKRFESKVERIPEAGCWIWMAATHKVSRYGHFYMRENGRDIWLDAHRAAWKLYRGIIPNGLYVCHLCDVRECVNPAHLFLGTQGDNLRDMFAKGRGNPRGIKNRIGIHK